MSDAPQPHKFYRLLRDTLYHTSGTILALEAQHVIPGQHELLTLPPARPEDLDEFMAEIRDAVASLGSRLSAIEEKPQPTDHSGAVTDLDDRVATLEQKPPVEPDMQDLRNTIASLEAKVAELEAAQVPASPPPETAVDQQH